ncbi:hypothetical protein DPMN_133787 [Dreissena polymorpha]|uniref:Uncharacterized protein n=1 Tax=Dreissena polymorpha TaxID=45954 RepID=A0A9D4FXQ8_DREPO|nr:hypothetical protein DPMN_133787 [Dreissena polymorpha]
MIFTVKLESFTMLRTFVLSFHVHYHSGRFLVLNTDHIMLPSFINDMWISASFTQILVAILAQNSSCFRYIGFHTWFARLCNGTLSKKVACITSV